jgi:hypothetical protein
MYINHIEYHKKLVSRIRTELGVFPPEWRIGGTQNWIEDMKGDCAALETELFKVQEEAIEIRKMVRVLYMRSLLTTSRELTYSRSLSNTVSLSPRKLLCSLF